MRKLNREPKTELRLRERELVPPNLIEEPRTVAQNYRNRRDRIPDHIAETAQPRELGRDLVPIGVKCNRFRRAESK